MKNDIAKRAERSKAQDLKYREMPDIVVKVVCKYRAELFFKISRKTKLSRLFNAWTDRMENGPATSGVSTTPTPNAKKTPPTPTPGNSQSRMQFICRPELT